MANNKSESFEKTLFKTADKLRKNMDAAEYKHIVLGLIFLKYISDSFEGLHGKLLEGKGDLKGADPEDADEYRAENVFFVPPTARWSHLHARAKQPSIGKDVDDAMEAIEKENPTLKIKGGYSIPPAVLAACSSWAKSLSKSIRASWMIFPSTGRRATRLPTACAG